jgi:hypothetical protein
MIRSKRRGHDLLKEARSDKEGPLPTQGRPDLLRRGHDPSRGKGSICNSKSNRAEPPQIEPQGPNYHNRHVSRLSHHKGSLKGRTATTEMYQGRATTTAKYIKGGRSQLPQGRPQQASSRKATTNCHKGGHNKLHQGRPQQTVDNLRSNCKNK